MTNNKFTKLAALQTLAERLKTEFATKTSIDDAIEGKADKATTLAGYGIEDAYTKEQLDGKISSVYKPGGSFVFADLPAADEEHLGMVYNVTDAFTTTDNFVEGAGKKHPAGTNVVVVSSGENFQYDVLSGFVDLSGYARIETVMAKEEGKGLSSNDFTDDEKTKLDSVSEGATKVETSETIGNIKINGEETKLFDVATDTEVTEMLDAVFGTSEEA